MKTIEELAREWADRKRPVKEDTGSKLADNILNDAFKEYYTEIATETLNLLLEELPREFTDQSTMYRTGWNAYKKQIKSLIQNKLK